MKPRLALLPTALVLTAPFSQAALTWTGAGDGVSLYQEANWQDHGGGTPAANTINPGVAVSAATGGSVEITGGTGAPNNFGGGAFTMASGDSLTVSGGKTLGSNGPGIVGGGAGAILNVTAGASILTGGITAFESIFVDNALIDLRGSAGIAMEPGPSTFDLANGASVITQFISLTANITVDATSSIQFLGTGDPINSQGGNATHVDLATGGTLILASAAEIDEQIGEGDIYVNGALVTLANRDSLLSITGGTATGIPEPSTALLGTFGLLALLRRRR